MTLTTDTPAIETRQDRWELRRIQDADAWRAIGKLMETMPAAVRIGDWRILGGTVTSMLASWPDTDDQLRTTMRRLARELDLTYAERPNGGSDSAQNEISASGVVDGVKIKFWQLVKACTCGCHQDGGAK